MDMIRKSGPPATVNQIRDISSRDATARKIVCCGLRARDRRPQPVVVRGGHHRRSRPSLCCWAWLSIFLVRQTSRERDEADQNLRDNNLNLEEMVDERTADLREANNGDSALRLYRQPRSALAARQHHGLHQRARRARRRYLPPHRRASLTSLRDGAAAGARPNPGELALEGADKQLSEDFSEALGFIKSSIAKMDRLISAILNLTREGRREFQPVKIDTRELIETMVSTLAHQAAEAAGRDPRRAPARHRQRPPRARADLLQSDRQCAQIPQERRPRRDQNSRAHQARLRHLRDQRQRPRDRSEGSSADIRPVPPRREPRTSPGRA